MVIDVNKLDKETARKICNSLEKVALAVWTLKVISKIRIYSEKEDFCERKANAARCDLIRETNKLTEIFQKIGVNIKFKL
jgi:tRNA nucleotidyltransferase/poly(A) polymerase